MGDTRLPFHLMGESVDWEGQDSGGYFPDGESAANYKSRAPIGYHESRFKAISTLLEVMLSGLDGTSGMSVLDFGIGDAEELRKIETLVPFGAVHGVDISSSMVKLARLNFPNATIEEGGVEALLKFESSSIEVVLGLNVLGYLSPEEENFFFLEAKRLLKGGGFLLITVGNLLFDLFALNSGTVSFFEREFGVSGAAELLTESERSRFLNARRHNPLSLPEELRGFGFHLVDTSFSQWHTTPPVLMEKQQKLSIRDARIQSRDLSFDPNQLPPSEKWKAFFQCSVVGLLFQVSE